MTLLVLQVTERVILTCKYSFIEASVWSDWIHNGIEKWESRSFFTLKS